MDGFWDAPVVKAGEYLPSMIEVELVFDNVARRTFRVRGVPVLL